MHPDYRIGEIDRRLFGAFLEPIGSWVYGGIWNPKHPLADDYGFRKDILEMTKELGIPAVRMPGGNFTSGWEWKDSIGPKEERKKHLDLAWRQYETNEIGHDEYLEWARRVNTDPLYTLNMGTGSIEDALHCVEYTNHEGGTYWSDLRKKNGYEKPHKVKTWCLGNEMDGPWQMGHKTAKEYGRIAAETSRLMKFMDPTIETVACGSSSLTMDTFGYWEEEVLGECYEQVDYLSLHQYYGNRDNNTKEFLANSKGMDEFISSVLSICDCVKAKKRSKKQINLSFDEWNVWYHSNDADAQLEKWVQAPHQLEDVYNFEDALLVGSMLITMLRHADRVKVACLAQLVNVIAPIMTSDTGAWRQTIFYPYMHASVYGRGTVLNTQVQAPVYESRTYGEVSCLDSVCIWNEEEEELTIFAVNKDLEEDLEVSCDFRQFADMKVVEHIVLTNEDLKAVNTEADPDCVVPVHSAASKMDGGHFTTLLGKHSWNVVRLKK